MTNSYFEKAFAELLDIERGYTVDKGGPTKYGVTEKVARAYGYTGDMQLFPLDFAKSIYHKEYWNNALNEFSFGVAYQVFDAAVNSGPERAAKWLQVVAGVRPDGVIGPITIAAIQAMDPLKVIVTFNCIRLQFMTGLINWPREGKGWSRRIVRCLKLGVTM